MSLVTGRSSVGIMESIAAAVDLEQWPTGLRPIKVLRPMGELMQQQEEEVDTCVEFLEVVEVTNILDIDSAFRRCLLNQSSEKENMKLIISHAHDEDDVTILCDLVERTVSLSGSQEDILNREHVLTPTLRAVSVVSKTGLCQSLFVGPVYIAVSTNCYQLNWRIQEDNSQMFSALHGQLQSSNCVMMFRGRDGM